MEKDGGLDRKQLESWLFGQADWEQQHKMRGERVAFLNQIANRLDTILGQPGKVRITTDGKVVRTTVEGMGVAFGRNYHLEPVAF